MSGIEAAREALFAGATEVDLDSDGYNEYRLTRDTNGNVLREEIDVDGNGTADLFWDYTGTTKTFRADVDGNGIAESSRDITEHADAPGIHDIVYTEDSSGDGIPDVRKSYTLDPSEDVVQVLIEEDSDQDGSFSTQMRFTTTRMQDASPLPVSSLLIRECTPEQRRTIDKAWAEAQAEGLACIGKLKPALRAQYAKVLSNTRITLACGSDPEACAHVDVNNAAFTWKRWFEQGKPERPIFVDPPAFDSSKCLRPLKSTLFHELSHYVIGLHEIQDGTDDPGDRVYGCENTCFIAANSQTCAQCLGEPNGATACKIYPHKPCQRVSASTYCRCNEVIYPSELVCEGSCPHKLGCYGSSTCVPLRHRGACRLEP